MNGKKTSLDLSGFELPTNVQFQELISCCKVSGVVERRNGHAGTLKLLGPNGNSILFNLENHFDNLDWMAWDHYMNDDDYYEEKDTTLPKECHFWLCTNKHYSKGEISNHTEFGKELSLSDNFNDALDVRLVKRNS